MICCPCAPLIAVPCAPGLLITIVCFPATVWPGLARVTTFPAPMLFTIWGLFAPPSPNAPGALTNLTIVAP